MSTEIHKATPRDRCDDDVGESRTSLFDTTAPFEEWLESVSNPKIELYARADPGNAQGMHQQSHVDSDCAVAFAGVLKVDGLLKRNIRSVEGTLVMTERGRIEANIDVRVALINGEVRGNIKAWEHVVLDRKARVIGNIYTPSLAIKDGAWFEGRSFLICRGAQLTYANMGEGRPSTEMAEV